MPLISLTAAPRSRFLMRISSCDPSSCAFRHTRHLRLNGNAALSGREHGEKTEEGRRGKEMTIYTQLIFCFIFRFLEAGTLGPEGRWKSEEEWRWGVLYRSRESSADISLPLLLACKTAEGGTGSPASPLSEVIEPDVVRWGREEHRDIQYTKPLLRKQWAEQLHTAQIRRKRQVGHLSIVASVRL